MKSTVYVMWRALLVGWLVLFASSLFMVWFGQEGLNAINGWTLFKDPPIFVGFVLLFITSFLPSSRTRNTIGWVSLVLLTLGMLYVFFSVPAGQSIGITFGWFSFSFPSLSTISVADSLSSASYGFWFALMVVIGLWFLFPMSLEKH